MSPNLKHELGESPEEQSRNGLIGALIIFARRQWREVLQVVTDRRTLSFLVLSASMIAVNRLIYIVAVQKQQVFQASLGYCINPLMNVVVGVHGAIGPPLSSGRSRRETCDRIRPRRIFQGSQ